MMHVLSLVTVCLYGIVLYAQGNNHQAGHLVVVVVVVVLVVVVLGVLVVTVV